MCIRDRPKGRGTCPLGTGLSRCCPCLATAARPRLWCIDPASRDWCPSLARGALTLCLKISAGLGQLVH
eukprot:13474652-Alexandrium_andersonii.AAC.1